jgi:subtilase family serine protease
VRLVCRSLLLGVLIGCVSAASASAALPKRITFYFGLTRPEAQARQAFFAVQQPGSSTYRRFLRPVDVAALYGASPSVRSAFIRGVRRRGFSVRIDPTGVFARVTGTVERFERVFRTRVTHDISSGSGLPVYVFHATRPLRLPSDLRPLVDDVVPDFQQEFRAPSAEAAAVAGPKRTGTWKAGCAKAKATGAFSYAQVRHAYGVDALGNGQPATVAILGVSERPSAKDIADNASCFGYRPLRSRTLLTDGQLWPIDPGFFEPQEDLALVRGMAPAASIIFTQVPADAAQWFLGVSQVLDHPPLPDSLSISYGICEVDVLGNGPDASPVTRAGSDLLNSLLVRLGLAGVGAYASAGDDGSSCDGALYPDKRPMHGTTWPGSSPYLTSVGGTRLTLTRSNARRDEVVWNDRHWKSADNSSGAGGGGFSRFSVRPPYQRGLGLAGGQRAVPDVSAAASAFPGWPVSLGGSWEADAGTSASAPLVASAMAIINAEQRRVHQPPLGPTNGLFYYLRRHTPDAFYDIVHGNNALVPGIPGYSAKPGYDLASGLGVPEFSWIARHLPAPANAAPRCAAMARSAALKSSRSVGSTGVAPDC